MVWEKFIVQLYGLVAVFKAARIMCPVAVQWMRPTAATVSALSISPFLNSDRIMAGLIAELPEYVAAAQVVVVAIEKEKEMVPTCGTSSTLVSGSEAGFIGAAFHCCS